MILVLAVGIAPAAAAPSQRTVHVVRRGQTPYNIARKYGVSVWTIASANSISNPNLIYAGRRLVIPSGRGAGGGQAGRVHVVQSGETLYSIARWYGVNGWTLARLNGIANPNVIHAGQRLTVP